MRRSHFLTVIILVIFFILAGGIQASALESTSYTVAYSEEKYVLSGDKTSEYDSVQALIDELPSGSSVDFSGVSLDGRVVINKPLTITGTLSSSYDVIIEEGADVTLNATVTFLSGANLRIRGGRATVSGGLISGSSGAVKLEGMSSGSFLMTGGRLYSRGADSPLVVRKGTAAISKGSLENPLGAAVENYGTLSLGRGAIFTSAEYGIYTEEPIYLSYLGESFMGSVEIRYGGTFGKGTLTPIALSCDQGHRDRISVTDKDGLTETLEYFDSYSGFDEKRFLGVYKPYTVKYTVGGVEYGEEKRLAGERLLGIDSPDVPGYKFSIWCTDESCERPYNAADAVVGDITLYGKYTLTPPNFTLSSKYTVYDGDKHTLTFTTLNHPLSEEGFYSFVWVAEDGREVSYSSELPYRDVKDSGRYKCIISFYHGRDSVTVETPFIELSIAKGVIDPPEASSVIYNGRVQYPEIDESAHYRFPKEDYVEAGKYYITFTLLSPENYRWSVTEDESVDVLFEIKRADNIWLDELRASDTYFGKPLCYCAVAKYGEVKYLFSDSPYGVYNEEAPHAVGRYYVIAVVEEGKSYTGMRSEPIELSVLEDAPISLTVLTPPEKVEYVAFERFDLSGLTFTVTHMSGEEKTVSARELTVYYQTDPGCLRYGDSAVIAEYHGIRATVPVTVSKAVYTLEDIITELSFTFDGTYKGYPELVGLPIGIDGIPLTYTATGGGASVGDYSVIITFSTSSRDYEIPSPVNATVTVEPLTREVVWNTCDFTYDGGVKCPTAYFTDITGNKVPLHVEGGAITAGSGYSAIAVSDDRNYRLVSDTCIFNIAKADYDMSSVRWSESSFIYNGEERNVVLTGLPHGVSAVGYTDNAYVNAGVYYASVTLGYDKTNYNPPHVERHEWRISKADYDTSGFTFTDAEYVYDGSVHYPALSGQMPIGFDGIPLTYSFSRGVRSVLDSPYVLIEFSTESDNYNVPEHVIAAVKISPMPIEVTWSDSSFTYNGDVQGPIAEYPDCKIRTEGGAVAVGEYTAYASSLDPDYRVTNGEYTYRIVRAGNSFLVEPKIEDIFFGRKPSPEGEAVGGEVVFRYYSDPECRNECEPISPGTYYVRAYSDGGQNYSYLESDIMVFRIIEVIPIGIDVTVRERDYRAFERLSYSDIVCVCRRNDGTSFNLEPDELTISYESGDSLLVGKGRVRIEYGELVTFLDIDVKRAVLDTSHAVWVNTEHVYDGYLKSPVLTGLPEGVRVIDILGDEAYVAGEYVLSAILEYDTANYEPPSIPTGVLRIKKQTVTPDSLGEAVYNGMPQTPTVTSAYYYVCPVEEYVSVGEYRIQLKLKDDANYVLSGDGYATFKIVPREVSILINDVSVYLFEEPVGDGYRVTSGEIIEGDDLDLEYIFTGLSVSAVSHNPNYKVEVTRGRAKYLIIPNRYVTRALLICLAVSVLLLLLFLYVIKHRDRFLSPVTVKEGIDAPGESVHKKRLAASNVLRLESGSFSSVDRERADELITNSIARTLVRRTDETVVTPGRKRAVINVDTLSENFDRGDRVDINILKEKGLVPIDAGYYKVLARGTLDKPLVIYANDFSISAVKMIALTGGEVYKLPKRPFQFKI